MAPVNIIAMTAVDIRFPTSQQLDGSDAMHVAPDYSAAYVILHTGPDDELTGHGLTFTNGRGTEVCVAALRALEPFVVGRSLDGIVNDMRGFWRSLVSDSQLRWLGPEKGVMHLAAAAIVNAVWDLWAKSLRVPLWKLLADLSPEELVGTIDFRYIDDVSGPDEAIDMLRKRLPGRATREQELIADGYPAYTTSAGWLGYDDEKIEALDTRGAGGRLHADQDEGGAEPRSGCAPCGADPRGPRRRRDAGDGRQPGLGRRRGDRRDARPRRVRPVVDRGAHEP